VSPYVLGSYTTIAQGYAQETYGDIHELAYTIAGNAMQKNSWSFTQLSPRCDVKVDLINLVPANLGPPGELFPNDIFPLSRDAAGNFATIDDGTRFLSYNSVSANGALVIWPRVWYLDLPNSEFVYLEGGVAPGVGSPGSANLDGTMWVSHDAVQPQATGPYNRKLRPVVLVHEMFHMVARVTHASASEGSWYYTVQPLTNAQETDRFVWNGRLVSAGIDQPQQWRIDQLAPVSTNEGGVWRSQCEMLRQDPQGFFVY
jgi:hypothetical protein